MRWSCSAYDPSVTGLCFFLEALNHPCDSRAECDHRMQLSQQELYAKIMELAKTGDPVWVALAEGINSAT